jgi:hypothetical protein
MINGKLSILFVGKDDAWIEIGSDSYMDVPSTLNISIQRTLQVFPGEDIGDDTGMNPPKLHVIFDSDWANWVTNTPEIIFEAASFDDIEFVGGPPGNVVITRKLISERPVSLPPSLEEEDDGLSVGAIIGIVVGVLVAIGVIGFCVYWFAIRPRTKAQGNDTPDQDGPYQGAPNQEGPASNP